MGEGTSRGRWYRW